MPVPVTAAKALPGGIYCPTVTFFQPGPVQELDLPANSKHFEFLARSGIDGITVQGSTGESVALDREEKKTLIRLAKEAFRKVGNNGAIIAGTVGAQSTREAITLARDAAEAGADYILSLPPSYYPGAMTPAALQSFYEDLADASPIPVLIYSYPGVCSGIDMDSDLITLIGRHPNVHGVKHTDHNVGKIARESRIKDYGSPFTILGGATDYLLGTLVYGGQGAITGISNIAPRVCAKAYELATTGRTEEALKVAQEISRAEVCLGKGGVNGTKYATVIANGFPAESAACRKPLALASDATKQYIKTTIKDVLALERQLEKEGYVGLGLRSAAPTKTVEKNGSTNGLVNTLKEKLAV